MSEVLYVNCLDVPYSANVDRHSYASRALALGESLSMIGRLLGHSQIETTARYAHLARDSAQAAAERVEQSIAADVLGEGGKSVRGSLDGCLFVLQDISLA